ncbi:MAG: CBS domain-containing protein [Rhodospirillales bacterium]|nr:CBS domain-containing protein [Rhodospirillales bacterium]
MKKPSTTPQRAYRSVGQILAAAPRAACWLGIEATVDDALRAMVERDLGCLVIVDGGAICGMFSERDFLRSRLDDARPIAAVPIAEAMNRRVVTVDAGRSVADCLADIAGTPGRYLVVIEDGAPAGIVAGDELSRWVIHHHETVINDMELEKLVLFARGTYSC